MVRVFFCVVFCFLSHLNLTHNFICRMWMELVVFIELLTPLSDVPVFLVPLKLTEKRRYNDTLICMKYLYLSCKNRISCDKLSEITVEIASWLYFIKL